MSESIWVSTTSDFIAVAETTATLLFEFPDIPEDMAEYYITDTAREIIKRTGGIIYEGEMPVYCGVNDYLVPVPECLRPLAVISVTEKGGCLPLRFRVDTQAWQIIFPSIARTRVLDVKVKCQLKQDACEIPGYIYEHYRDVLLNGTKARLHRLSNMDFFNLDLAEYYENKFEDGVYDMAVDKVYNGRTEPLMANFGG